MIYAKAVRTDLSPDAKRAVKALADQLRRARRPTTVKRTT